MDKKPHEEQWTYDIGMEAVVDCDGAALTTRLDPGDCRLIAAAPEMARALVEQGVDSKGQWHSAVCLELGEGMGRACIPECVRAREALRKAGVL